MTLKRIKASGSYARMAKKLITLDFKSGGTTKDNRFVSADDQ